MKTAIKKISFKDLGIKSPCEGWADKKKSTFGDPVKSLDGSFHDTQADADKWNVVCRHNGWV